MVYSFWAMYTWKLFKISAPHAHSLTYYKYMCIKGRQADCQALYFLSKLRMVSLKQIWWCRNIATIKTYAFSQLNHFRKSNLCISHGNSKQLELIVVFGLFQLLSQFNSHKYTLAESRISSNVIRMQFYLLFYDYYSTISYINSQGILDTWHVCVFVRVCAFCVYGSKEINRL